ncbi:signal peptidase [Neisseria weixii]|uniref:signal peptidase n=1 Tax=Neisseria weixii TaxID=1853276 RepID=UPI0030B86571
MNGLGFYAFVMGATNCVAFLHIHEGRLKIETAAINAFPDGQRPLQNPHLWHISSLYAARKLACLDDMSALSVLPSLRTVLKSGVLQRSRPEPI